MNRVAARGDFIDGRWVLPAAAAGAIDVRSPADLDDVVGAFPVSAVHVDAAVEAARAAQGWWEARPLAERIDLVRRFGRELAAREDEFVPLLGREVGKPVWEAQNEVRALGAKIDLTIDEGLSLVGGFELEGGRLACRFRPHGVLAVVGPFNFPLHLPHGHIVPALLTGNTVVFKPSEVAPATAQLYGEAARAAGFPPGVFNLVQGRGPEGAALSAHPGVDGVLFTGSYETGVAIRRANAQTPGRVLALELGGKNTAVVLADAPVEKALYDILYSALATTGQRCTAVSRVVVERAIAEPFLDALVRRTAGFRVGHPAEPGVFFGPLATAAAWERFQAAHKVAEAEGVRTRLASRDPELRQRGWYVSPSIHEVPAVLPDSAYQSREIFGPDIAVFVADDLEHACALADATDYGLAAAVFTTSRTRFEACALRLRVGCLAWNAPTVGSSSRLPFGGVKRSGNHRPAALFSPLYCTYPVAVTRGAEALPKVLPPGVDWPSAAPA